jgi:hypothetical protein
MAWGTGRKNVELSFSDMSGGVANAYPPHSIADNQLADAFNIICEKKGCSRAPGLSAISTAALFDTELRGWFIYRKLDGTEIYIAVSDKKIYSVSLTAGTKTQIGTLSADTECTAVNSNGKLWIVNGTDAVKIESTLAVYRIGIAAPTGFTATNTGTGTLAAGAYKVAVSYTRKISGTAVLHSAPQIVSTVTVSGSELIRIATTASLDPQVTHITAWLTDAAGSVYYYYGDTTNATGNFDIANATNKNANLVMYEQAAGNQLPLSLTKIYSYDGRLWGLKADSNEIYYTLRAQNVYDLEKWPTENHIPTIPTTVYSLHAVKGDLHVNTPLGMFIIQNFDTTAKPLPVLNDAQGFGQILYFLKDQKLAEHNGLVFGVTNDGFRFYDGEKFSIDISQHIKPWMDKVSENADDFPAHAIVLRRAGKRTELQLSYNNNEISVTNHNETLVLNIDTLSVTDAQNYNASWEKWSNGYKAAIVTNTNILVVAQCLNTASVIAIQTGSADINAISEEGAYVLGQKNRRVFMRSRTTIQALIGYDVWKEIYWLAKLQSKCTGKVVIADRFDIESDVYLQEVEGLNNQPVIDGTPPLILDFVLPEDSIAANRAGLCDYMAGNSVYIEIAQANDDPTFFIYALELYGYHEIERVAQ